MAPWIRGTLFFLSLLLAPALFALGDRLGGTLLASAFAGVVVLAAMVWMGRGTPPSAGTP